MIGSCRLSGIFLSSAGFSASLKRAHRLLKVKNLPECNAEVQNPNPCHGATDPSRGHQRLQCVHAGFARCVQKEIVVAPIAQPKKSLWDPRQEREHNANLEA